MKVGIVGTGWWARCISEVLSKLKGIQLIGAYSPSLERCKEFCNERKIIPFHSLASLVESNLDLVFIAIPNAYCLEVAKECLSKGVPVYIEKPASANEHSLTLFQEQFNLHDFSKKVFVGYNKKFSPSLTHLKNLVKGNQITNFNFRFYNGMYLKETFDWRRSSDHCPLGPFTQLGVHCIDFLLDFFENLFLKEIHFSEGDPPMQVTLNSICENTSICIDTSYVSERNFFEIEVVTDKKNFFWRDGILKMLDQVIFKSNEEESLRLAIEYATTMYSSNEMNSNLSLFRARKILRIHDLVHNAYLLNKKC